MTDARPRHGARINLSAREWKLYLVGGLGLAYAASLVAIGTRADLAAPRPNAAPPVTAAVSQPAVVWLDQLPVSQRPNVSPPSSAPRTAAAAPRIMTRSS